MGKAYANRKPLEERPEADFHSTPYSLTWELLKLSEFDLSKPIYEPASGSGAISSQLKKYGFTVFEDDIRTTGKDFLDCNNHFPYIITNPPFSLFTQFVDKAKQCSDKFAFIMKTNFLGCQSRLENETWKYLKSLYVFSRQIDYRTPLREDGKMCVGNLITGWGVWDMSWDKDYFQTKVIDVQKYCTLGGFENYTKICNFEIENKEIFNGSKHDLYLNGIEKYKEVK
jgi:hypothetical protein